MNRKLFIILSFLATFALGTFAGILMMRFNLVGFRFINQRETRLHRSGFSPRESSFGRLPVIDPEIMEELDLTPEQHRKIETLITESRKIMQEELSSVHTQMARYGKEVTEEITKILNSEQQKKYREILETEKLNFPPPVFIFDVEELKLSDAQRKKIEEILEKQAQDLRIGYRDVRRHLSGPMHELRTRIDSVLTVDQQKRLRELTGHRGWRKGGPVPRPER